jgi:L-fuculose-phosphate aldolase
MKYLKHRKEVASFMRRLYDQKLTTTSGGNVSQRVDDVILITASKTDKASIDEHQIGILTLSGDHLSENLKLSMESKIHLAIYNNRPDVKAIVHAHPVFATSFTIAGKAIKTNLAGESRAVLGEPVVAPYALMGTQKLADNVGLACLRSSVILMENHGIITVGENLLQAYDRMEVLEAAAKMTLVTFLLGGGKELSEIQLREIDELFNNL